MGEWPVELARERGEMRIRGKGQTPRTPLVDVAHSSHFEGTSNKSLWVARATAGRGTGQGEIFPRTGKRGSNAKDMHRRGTAGR